MAGPGYRNDLTDVKGLKVGQAHNLDVKTGVSVIVGDKPMTAGVDVRGGGPGTRETDTLNAGGLVDQVDAIVLSGGSVYGLAACDGVCARLGAMGRGYGLIDQPGVPKSPIVPGAILYDLANGGDKGWGDHPPYRDLGIEALEALSDGPVKQGKAGAGFGAQAGQYPGGTGSASFVTEDGFTIAALVCVNSFGSPTLPGTEAYWAWPLEIDGEFGGVRPPADYTLHGEDWGAAKVEASARTNTTIGLIATDAILTKDQARRMAVMAQDGLARALRPIHTPFDGDVVFVVSTGLKPLSEPQPFTLARLGSLAADCLARAVARGCHGAKVDG